MNKLFTKQAFVLRQSTVYRVAKSKWDNSKFEDSTLKVKALKNNDKSSCC